MSVAFVTFGHPPRYINRLHDPGVLRGMVESHKFNFDEVIVVHNQCKAEDYPPFDYPCRTVDLPRLAFDGLLARWGVNPHNARCEEITHGEGAAHWWVVHNVNHLCGLENTSADFIVFADCDTKIVRSDPARSWVDEAISILDRYPQVLIVSPSDGGTMAEATIPEARLTRNVSQQLFCCRGDEFRQKVDFDVPWDGRYTAPGGPFQEFYCLAEGRLWRYMETTGQYRAILPDRWRYYHNSYWATDREKEGWGPYG
jgi:hypothetical protein